MRQALQDNQIELYCQPKVDLRRRAVVGGEVLIRWRHPRYGELTPDVFVPLAEKCGLIREVTLYIIERVIRFMDTHFNRDEQIKLSINISVKDFTDPDFSTKTILLVKEWTDHLIFEITETAIIKDTRSVLKSVTTLQKAGIALSIDDFGTGFSSLSYLKQLDPAEIKLDQLFVKNLCISPTDRVVVTSTINMAHGLGIQVVAEGAEDTETVRLLADLNCDIVQGYGLAKPMEINDFWEWSKRPEMIVF
ncbi:MAG: EAL domain-containing protein [Gammaproteobacteria bacterium]